ncbi:MAG: hypothetical protein ACRD88_22395 [Terriglobia bacterium]
MHGLEREWAERVQFVHVNFRSPMGKELGRRYEIEHLPALVLLNRAGEVQRKFGMALHLRAEIEAAMEGLLDQEGTGNRE